VSEDKEFTQEEQAAIMLALGLSVAAALVIVGICTYGMGWPGLCVGSGLGLLGGGIALFWSHPRLLAWLKTHEGEEA